MSLDTYSNLLTAITDHANSSKVTLTVAADLVLLAEAEMNRRIRTRRKMIRSEATLSAEFVDLPSDLESILSLILEDTDPPKELTYVDPAKAVELKNSTYTTSGEPVHYSIIGDELQIIPSPESSYDAEMTYRQKLPPLVTNSTNWLLDSHPDLYLYGSLRHAGVYLVDDPRISIWDSAFERGLLALEQQDSAAQFPAGRLNARARSFG